MHAEAYDGVRQMIKASGLDPAGEYHGLDLGGADVNGTARDLLPNATWIGLDITPGSGVQFVEDARTWTPTRQFDVVLSTELLEHVSPWQDCVATAREALQAGGTLILTCAGPGREPHSCKGHPRPLPGEAYNNIDPDDLGHVLAALFAEWGVVYDPEHCDTYAWARA